MKRMQRALGVTAIGLLCLQPLQGTAAAPEAETELQNTTLDDPAQDRGGLLVRYKGGQLTVDIDNRPLRDVVAALAEQLPIKVYMKASIKEETGDKAISRKFEDLPLQNALRDLFRTRNFVVKRARPSPSVNSEAAEIRPIEIWFLGGTGAYSELASNGSPSNIDPPAFLASLGSGEDAAGLSSMSEADLRNLARDASSETLRGHALIELGNRVENPENVEAFVSSLEDDSKKVRWRALSQILGVQQDLDDTVYRRVIDEDPDPFLRKQALAMLVFKKRHGAEGTLAELRSSEDEKMRAYAQELTAWLAKQDSVPKP